MLKQRIIIPVSNSNEYAACGVLNGHWYILNQVVQITFTLVNNRYL